MLSNQVRNNFYLDQDEESMIHSIIDYAISKVDNCFNNISNKYYRDENNLTIFNPFHSGQYSIFLYFLSRAAYLDNNIMMADKIYYLNKIMNGVDIFYEVILPEVFFMEHPLGSVIGRAKIGNFFSFQQNCTVGGNRDLYPEIGTNVRMFSNSSIIGKSTIGSNVFISSGSMVKNENILSNTIVFGRSPNLHLVEKPIEYFDSLSPFKH